MIHGRQPGRGLLTMGGAANVSALAAASLAESLRSNSSSEMVPYVNDGKYNESRFTPIVLRY